jgi:hypothetical protein
VPLVEWNTRREIDTKVAELQDGLEKMMSADPPHSANDIIAFVKSRKAEQVWWFSKFYVAINLAMLELCYNKTKLIHDQSLAVETILWNDEKKRAWRR